eukprot:TRINITY_DN6907_c0_g1_i1.p1 TRINITY_DN6907_c0_g1~~TRINITY_DN6907_c0_g1_i1.p1  ORF type:complete len:508 (+),score=52.14 TRINITY_DN6907_c0_g1_i1:67-1590(+)
MAAGLVMPFPPRQSEPSALRILGSSGPALAGAAAPLSPRVLTAPLGAASSGLACGCGSSGSGSNSGVRGAPPPRAFGQRLLGCGPVGGYCGPSGDQQWGRPASPPPAARIATAGCAAAHTPIMRRGPPSSDGSGPYFDAFSHSSQGGETVESLRGEIKDLRSQLAALRCMIGEGQQQDAQSSGSSAPVGPALRRANGSSSGLLLGVSPRPAVGRGRASAPHLAPATQSRPGNSTSASSTSRSSGPLGATASTTPARPARVGASPASGGLSSAPAPPGGGGAPMHRRARSQDRLGETPRSVVPASAASRRSASPFSAAAASGATPAASASSPRARSHSPSSQTPPVPSQSPCLLPGADAPGKPGAGRVDCMDELWCEALKSFPEYPHWYLVKERTGVYRMGGPTGRRLLCRITQGHLQVRVGGGWVPVVPFMRRYGPAGMLPRGAREEDMQSAPLPAPSSLPSSTLASTPTSAPAAAPANFGVGYAQNNGFYAPAPPPGSGFRLGCVA